jgi:hypothetical protein
MRHPYIPVLTGESAQEFVDKAECNQNSTDKIDFSDKIEAMKCILHKSGFVVRCDSCTKKEQVNGYTYILP